MTSAKPMSKFTSKKTRKHKMFSIFISLATILWSISGYSLAILATPTPALAVAPPPSILTISIDAINSEPPAPQCYLSPIEISGSGSITNPKGNSPYYVSINWGDGFITEDMPINGIETGNTINYTFTTSPDNNHNYQSIDFSTTITAYIHHSQFSGNDGTEMESVTLNICVAPPDTGILTIKKSVVNGGEGQLAADDFNLHVKLDNVDVTGSPAAGSETGTQYILDPDTYVVSEDEVAGYEGTFSSGCEAGNVTLAKGEEKICTITNTYSPAIATSLVVTPLTDTYGNTVSLVATLSPAVSGKSIAFTLNGVTQGTAVTDGSGIATLPSVSLIGINAGIYPTGVGASFAGDTSYSASSGTATLTINQKSITITADAQTKVYGASDPALTYQITSGSLVGSDAFTGALARDPGEAVGTYAISQGTLSAGSNYTITYTGADFTINAKDLSITANDLFKFFGQILTFVGNEFTTSPLIIGDSVTNVTLNSAGADSSALEGIYDIIPSAAVGTGLSNYLIDYINGRLTVNSKVNPEISWSNPADITYGTALDSTQLNATANTLGTFTYTPAAGTVLNAGASQILHVDFVPDDTVTYNNASANVNINVLTKSISVTADAKSKTYGDADQALTYTNDPLVGTDTFSGVLTRATGEIVGTYPISQGTLSAGSNYAITYTGADFTINKKAITVTADNKSKTAGNADPALTYQITSGTLVGADTLSGALTRDAGEAVGTYAITQGTLSAGGNYDLTYATGVLTINATEPICGNGIKEGDEQCDGTDGVTEGYLCTTQCTLEQIISPVCGDQSCNGSETCSTCSQDCGACSTGGGGGGGGGVGGPISLLIHDIKLIKGSQPGSVIMTWFTNREANTRVIYDTISHLSTLGLAPNYGYQWSTGTTDTDPKVLFHSVTITGLLPAVVYYFRPLSAASPEIYGDELSITLEEETSPLPPPTEVTPPPAEIPTPPAETFPPAGNQTTPTPPAGTVAGVEYPEEATGTTAELAGEQPAAEEGKVLAETTGEEPVATPSNCSNYIWLLLILNLIVAAIIGFKGRNGNQLVKYSGLIPALIVVALALIWYPECWLVTWLTIVLILAIIYLIILFARPNTLQDKK